MLLSSLLCIENRCVAVVLVVAYHGGLSAKASFRVILCSVAAIFLTAVKTKMTHMSRFLVQRSPGVLKINP